MNLSNRRRYQLIFAIIGTASFKYKQALNESLKEGNKQLRRVVSNDEQIINSSDDRPVMHTFYEGNAEGYCCGMLESGHLKLLEVWEKSWQDKGWATKVLTKEDAERHPDFSLLQEKLTKLQVDQYNQKCWWRWLSMASITDGAERGGGGWMSDYDTFPLELDAHKGRTLEQENNGQFTSYQDHVPSLIHASREEWDRVLHLMIDMLPERINRFASDMNLLLQVRDELGDDESGIKWQSMIENTFPYVKKSNGDLAVDCPRCRGELAVHLSHKGVMVAVRNDLYPEIDRKLGVINGRGTAAQVFMEEYNEQCQDGQKEEMVD